MSKKNSINKQSPTEMPENHEDALDLLGDGVRRNIAEDPLLKFVQQRWRFMVLVIAIVFAGLYGKNVYDSTQQAARERSADLLIEMQTAFDKFTLEQQESDKKDSDQATDSKEDKKDNNNQAVLVELISALAQEREPYRSIGAVYNNLLVKLLPESGLKPLNVSQGNMASGEQNIIFTELNRLAIAQEGLDSQEPSIVNAAVEDLKSLVSSAEFVSVPALVILARSTTDQTLEETIEKLATALAKRQPEQAELLKSELPEYF